MAFWYDNNTGTPIGQYRSERSEKVVNAYTAEEVTGILKDLHQSVCSALANARNTEDTTERDELKAIQQFCEAQLHVIEDCTDVNAVYSIDVLHVSTDKKSAIIPYNHPTPRVSDILDRNYTVYRRYTLERETWECVWEDGKWHVVRNGVASCGCYRPVLMNFHPVVSSNKEKMQELADRNNRLTTYTCVTCAAPFVLPEGEKQFYKENKLQMPKRCRKCRIERKREKEK